VAPLHNSQGRTESGVPLRARASQSWWSWSDSPQCRSTREPSDLLEDVDPGHVVLAHHYVEHPLAWSADPSIDLREVQPEHVGEPGVDGQDVLDLAGGVDARGDGGLVELGGEVVGRLVGAVNLPPAGGDGVVVEAPVAEVDVRLPHPGEGVEVVGEPWAKEAVPAGDADGRHLDGGDDGRVGGEGVEADVGGDGGEDEVGVGPEARGGVRPGRAEREHERGGRGDVEGRGAE
jgi:hypothetical protein